MPMDQYLVDLATYSSSYEEKPAAHLMTLILVIPDPA